MDLNEIAVDPAKIEEGEWVDEIPGMGDLRLQVRGLNCIGYRRAIDRRVRALPRSDRGRDGSISPEANDKLTGQAMAEALLLGWDGLTAGGQPVPYTKAKATELLTSPRFAALRGAVFYAAGQVGAEVEEHQQAILGNSETPSVGTSTGEPSPQG